MKNLLTWLFLLFSVLQTLGQDTIQTKEEIKSMRETIPDRAIILRITNIATDRPGFTESSLTTPFKNLQIENGASYSSDKTYDYHATNFSNTAVIKYGIGYNVELRAITNMIGLKQEHVPSGETSKQKGMDVLTLGTKVRLNIASKFFKTTSILAHIALNQVASPEFRTKYPAHNVLISNTTGLSPKLDMNINLGASWNGYSPSISGLYTLNFGYAITHRLGSFIELYGNWDQASPIGSNVDLGLTYLAKYNLQFDISGGLGLTENTTDWFVSGGISYMFKMIK